MRLNILLLVLFSIILGLDSCSSTKYSVDYDENIDFYRYATYNFTPAADSIPMNQLNKRRLFNAISQEMNNNDIQWNAEPDLYIHVHAMMKGRTKTNVTYGHGETISLGSGFSNTYVDLSEYSEGTLFFDIIDSERKQLVWTGKAVSDIKDSGYLSEKDLQKIVKQVFRKFPPGSPR